MIDCDKFCCEDVVYLRDSVDKLTKRVRKLEETIAWMLVDVQDQESVANYPQDSSLYP